MRISSSKSMLVLFFLPYLKSVWFLKLPVTIHSNNIIRISKWSFWTGFCSSSLSWNNDTKLEMTEFNSTLPRTGRSRKCPKPAVRRNVPNATRDQGQLIESWVLIWTRLELRWPKNLWSGTAVTYQVPVKFTSSKEKWRLNLTDKNKNVLEGLS